jgi:SAM-dependent methyltransferase
MKLEFLKILACPECHGKLEFDGPPNVSDVQSGTLTCLAGHTFNIIRGVPRFVSAQSYADNFGFEWNLHNTTQLDTPTSHESEETFIAKTGFSQEELRGRLVLDVGCGMGRFSDVASRWGATVVGVDLSSAVDAAAGNLGRRAQVHLAQADVFRLPFGDATFDYIFSIGVLHHTPNTRAAFDQLPRLVKPGGKIAIWVYSTEMRRWCWSSDLYRQLTTRMPRKMLHALCHAAVPMYYVHKAPVIGRFSSVLVPMSVHSNPSWRVLDTFDWYSPKYQWKHSTGELREWFSEHRLGDLKALETETSLQGTRSLVTDD